MTSAGATASRLAGSRCATMSLLCAIDSGPAGGFGAMPYEADRALAVVVPSFGRPAALTQCLAALAQEEAAREVVAVVRAGDGETAAVVRRFEPRVAAVFVSAPGVLAAMQTG